MACVSRPKPPAFWGQTAMLLILLGQVIQTGSEAQVDVPPDSLYFDPRYQFNPSPPPFQGRPQGKADQRSLNPLNYQQFNPYSQIPQPGFAPNPNPKPVKEVTLDDALNAFLKTQDPKYYQYYQGGNPRDGAIPVTSGPPGTPYTADPQVAALLKQIDSVGSQQCAANVLAQWNFETNVNEVTQVEAWTRWSATLQCGYASRHWPRESKWDSRERLPGPSVTLVFCGLLVSEPRLPPDLSASSSQGRLLTVTGTSLWLEGYTALRLCIQRRAFTQQPFSL
ncbi:hypothetical protein J6590_012352 [Homalodisca vitripennis]|nr:hypothetical protein J6590_012352 [Homalodisca vitripennis]